MKKIVYILAITLLTCTACITLYSFTFSDDFLNANAEGLMIQPRSNDGDAAPCYYAGKAGGENDCYYDCNKCVKIYGKRGVGESDTCGVSWRD